jgi:hypothetical protein
MVAPPLSQPGTQVIRIEIESVANGFERKRPGAFGTGDPSLCFVKKSPAGAAFGVEMFLKTLNGVGQDREHQALLRREVRARAKDFKISMGD